MSIMDPQRKHLKAPFNPAGLRILPRLGWEFQSTKYPRLKNIKDQWHYDLELEEKKRYVAGGRQPPKMLWARQELSEAGIELYLDKFCQIARQPMIKAEETALRWLVEHDHNTIEALVAANEMKPAELAA